jgi:hypothetical protein
MLRNIVQKSVCKNRYQRRQRKEEQMGEKMSNLIHFAEACYNQNSLNELKFSLKGATDETDLLTWNLTEAEWREALKIAIIAIEQDISVEDAARQIH